MRCLATRLTQAADGTMCYAGGCGDSWGVWGQLQGGDICTGREGGGRLHTRCRGWLWHSLQCAFSVLLDKTSFYLIVRIILGLGSDWAGKSSGWIRGGQLSEVEPLGTAVNGIVNSAS